jgi:hypothetical protein
MGTITQCAYDKFGIPMLIGIKYVEAHDFADLESHCTFANKHISVIGNIWENPELLKETK